MKTQKMALAAMLAAACLLFSGCAREGLDYATPEADIVDSFPFEAEPAGENPQQAAPSDTYAVFHTSAGDITVMLYPDEEPEAVARFMQQVQAGKYDGQQFVYVRSGGLIESDNAAREDEATQSSTPPPSGSAAAASQEAVQDVSAPQGAASGTQEESVPEGGYTEDELAAVELPEAPDGVDAPHYSDELHHYRGAVGVSRQNESGGDRLHFIVETTTPGNDLVVPAQLYMNELVNLRMAQLNAMTAQTPFTAKQLAAYELRLNKEIQVIGTDGIPQERAQAYEAARETYARVGGQWALDYQYPIIGQITEGLNVAQAISQAKVTAATRQPKQEITIEYVEIVEN